MKLNRRSFMQLCGLTAGGGVLGVGKAAEETVMALTAKAGTPLIWERRVPGLEYRDRTFTVRWTPSQWEARQTLCRAMYVVGHDGLRYIYSNEETGNEH